MCTSSTATSQPGLEATWGRRLERWAPVYARLALGAAFLSAVASRLGLWSGEPAAQRFAGFVRYTAEVNAFMPSATIPFLAVAATVAELGLGLGLLVGVRLRAVAGASALLLALPPARSGR